MDAVADMAVPPLNEATGDAQAWHSINWAQAERDVRRLRQRIFTAAQEGDLKKVRNLQKLMLRSHANTLVSVRRVTQLSAGRRTPGIDGLRALTAQERGRLARTLADEPATDVRPVRRVHIPKAGGKTRPLGIPTIRDRAQQARVKNALEPEWEARFEGKNYGFRPGRGCHDAIEKIFRLTARSNTRRTWVLDADLAGAFDRIDHTRLMDAIGGFPAEGAILRWLKAGVMQEGRFAPTEEGTPQGGVISPLLLNIALHGMGTAIGDLDTLTERQRAQVPLLVRYADDFVVFCTSKTEAEQVQEKLAAWLKPRGLTIHPDKTRIARLEDGFDFLGFNVRKYGPKTLIKPSATAVKRIREKIRRIIEQCRTTELLIQRLNPLIKGWATYYRGAVAKEIFAGLDHYVWHRTWRWALRRHPQKTRSWIKDRYFGSFHSRRDDHWVFGDHHSGRYLYKFAWTVIQRHIPVKATASKDDPSLAEYWAARTRKRRHPQADGHFHVGLAAKQKGLCPLCGLDLIAGAEYEPNSVRDWAHWFTALHRTRTTDSLIYRSTGGNNAPSPMLIHAECHRNHHTAGNQRGPLEHPPARSLGPA